MNTNNAAIVEQAASSSLRVLMTHERWIEVGRILVTDPLAKTALLGLGGHFQALAVDIVFPANRNVFNSNS